MKHLSFLLLALMLSTGAIAENTGIVLELISDVNQPGDAFFTDFAGNRLFIQDKKQLTYRITTGAISGDVPLHFAVGSKTLNRTVTLLPDTTYIMNIRISISKDGINLTTHYDIYGQPSSSEINYPNKTTATVTVSGNDGVLISSETTLLGQPESMEFISIENEMSGAIGNLIWRLSQDGTLTISGTGAIPEAPWYSRKDDITKIVIEEGITTIESSVFEYHMKVTSVELPNSLTAIGNWAFMGCRGITNLTLPQSVDSIGNYTFSYCYGLTSITLPNSLTTIGESAFNYCTALQSITIPRSVTNIGESAFSSCKKLTGFTVESGNQHYTTEDGVLFNAAKTSLLCYPIAKPETSYTVPDGVQSIEANAFCECLGLTSIVLPQSLLTIGYAAFGYNPNLTTIAIPPSVTTIERTAFWNCTGLNYLIIPSSVTSIGNQAFQDCTGLKYIIVSWANPSVVSFSQGSDIFKNITASDVKLYVPTGTASAYRNSSIWGKFDVTEGSESFDNRLSSLILDKGLLRPSFEPSRLSYIASVENAVTAITLSATPVRPANTVSGAGEKALVPGENTFTVTVTAGSGENQTYTLKVYRLPDEYVLNDDGFADRTEKKSLYVEPHGRAFNFDVITGRDQHYLLETSDVSGNLPLHFDFGDGITCDRTIALQPFSRYRITLTLSTDPGNPISITTPINGSGNPGTPYINYTQHEYAVIASAENTVLMTSAITVSGTLTAASVSEVTFEGNTGLIFTESNPLRVYSHPASGRLTISGLQGNETLRIYSISGNLLLSDTATGETTVIDVAHLPAGIYLVGIQSDKGISTHKFIK